MINNNFTCKIIKSHLNNYLKKNSKHLFHSHYSQDYDEETLDHCALLMFLTFIIHYLEFKIEILRKSNFFFILFIHIAIETDVNSYEQ